MRISVASWPGDPGSPNEDWALATPGLVIVLDGQTARTRTGCRHGVSWYVATLGAAIATAAADPALPLDAALAQAIERTAARHPECDLGHPATPSATVATVRFGSEAVDYLTLGDTVVLAEECDADVHESETETAERAGPTGGPRAPAQRPHVLFDNRIGASAGAERRAADRHPIGSPEKREALLRMKHAELAQRNRPGGFWVAAADPSAASHALCGELPAVDRLAVLTDGAARIAVPFGLADWPGVLDLLASHGPDELIRRVRAAEAEDPTGTRWPRNKRGDDATAVYLGS